MRELSTVSSSALAHELVTPRPIPTAPRLAATLATARGIHRRRPGRDQDRTRDVDSAWIRRTGTGPAAGEEGLAAKGQRAGSLQKSTGIGTGTPKKKSRQACNLPELLARRTGLEPAASGVTGRRYNQLNYRRIHLRASPFGTGLVAWGVGAVKDMIPKPNLPLASGTIAAAVAAAMERRPSRQRALPAP